MNRKVELSVSLIQIQNPTIC